MAISLTFPIPRDSSNPAMSQILSSRLGTVVRLRFVSNGFVASRNFASPKEKYVSERRKVPAEPFIDRVPPRPSFRRVEIDEDTISHLENLSLVDCANREGIKILQDAILFAQKIFTVETSDKAPLYTVLENGDLKLRRDIVTVKNSQKEILKNSSAVFEDYFVAPPGNIPLEARNNLLYD